MTFGVLKIRLLKERATHKPRNFGYGLARSADFYDYTVTNKPKHLYTNSFITTQ